MPATVISTVSFDDWMTAGCQLGKNVL